MAREAERGEAAAWVAGARVADVGARAVALEAEI